MEIKRAISLADFANNLPPDIASHHPALGRLVFGSRSVDTVPYRVKPGAIAAITAEEVLNTPISVEARVYTFDTSKEEDRLKYQQILKAIESKWFVAKHLERQWDKEAKSMRVYIEVIERYRLIEPKTAYQEILAKINN